MAIVLDAMGSDDCPVPEIQAAIELYKNYHEKVILVGKQEILDPKIHEFNSDNIPLEIVNAPDVIEMTDKPVESARTKPNNSMAVGLSLVKEGKAEAFVSAGNSGAALFNSVKVLHQIPGVSRPALCAVIPTKTGKCVFLDTGANVDCRPEFLYEFAIMGSVYAEKVLGISSPKVGLLANGEEAGKGNELVKSAYSILQASSLHFFGNVEPKEVYSGKIDVLVADGFSGNVFLKTSEAVARFMTDLLKENISANLIRKLGYLLSKQAFTVLKSKMDPAEVGAAMLLGVNGPVFVGHGHSNSRAMVSAVLRARSAVDAGLLPALRVEIQDKLHRKQSESEN